MAVYVSRGSRGQAVEILQDALNNLGYGLDVDGIFGRNTQNAVLDFQANNGLAVDGIVGPGTWGALGIVFEQEPEVRLLAHGAQGDDVAALQTALVNAGYDLYVDGVFGGGTHDAVCDFQANNGLVVDGIVGPRTWAALEPHC